MQCESRAAIRGSMADVLAVAVPVERWSLLMPHYPWVRIIGRHGAATVVQFTAWRGPLRLRWTAEQTADPAAGRIVYRHLRGPTRGLRTEWHLEPDGAAVRVSVRHAWQPGWFLVGPAAAALLCSLLVRPLTQRTLAELERIVISGRAAALRRLDAATTGGATE